MMDKSLFSRVEQMRLRDLLLLEKIADLGSLRRVAESLHITQPAITQALKGLEQAFGIALVDRGRTGAHLTAAGEAVLTRVRAASQELRAAQNAALSSASPTLRVGSSPAAMLTLVPHALAVLRKRAPHVQVVLAERGVAALWTLLDEGEFDVIVTRLPNSSQGKRLPDGLVFDKVANEKMVLACARQHPASKRKMSASELAACDWAMPPADALAVVMLNEWFAQSGVRPPTPKLTCGSFYASLQVVARSDLLTIVPESAALALQTSLKVTRVLSSWGQSQLDIVIAYRSSSANNREMQLLKSCFTTQAKA